MPLQDRMDEYKRGFEAKAPKAALAVMHRATKDLAESGVLARAVKVGDLEDFNGDASWTLPLPARMIIDTDGVIR